MPGYKNFAAGAVLGESDLDDYLMSQTNMRFASAAARDSALSGVLDEGLIAILEDVDTVTMYNGTAWVTIYHYGNMSTWTPSLTQNGVPTITVNHATYQRQGKQITAAFHLVIASGTGTAANVVSVGLPFAAFTGAGVNDVVGHGFIYDSSAGLKYRALLVFGGVSTMQFLTLHSTTDGYLGATDFTAALAVNDVLTGSFRYEALTSG